MRWSKSREVGSLRIVSRNQLHLFFYFSISFCVVFAFLIQFCLIPQCWDHWKEIRASKDWGQRKSQIVTAHRWQLILGLSSALRDHWAWHLPSACLSSSVRLCPELSNTHKKINFKQPTAKGHESNAQSLCQPSSWHRQGWWPSTLSQNYQLFVLKTIQYINHFFHCYKQVLNESN